MQGRGNGNVLPPSPQTLLGRVKARRRGIHCGARSHDIDIDASAESEMMDKQTSVPGEATTLHDNCVMATIPGSSLAVPSRD